MCINHLLYADDMCIIASSILGLQMLLDICKKFCIDSDIIINVSKTKCMYFYPTNLPNIPVGNVNISGEVIERIQTFKYLGHTLHFQLNDTQDILSQLRQLYGRGNSIIRKFKNCSTSVKRTIFNAFCTTMYCCSLWTVYNDYMMNRVKVAYNNLFRKLFSLPYDCSASEMFVNNRVKTFVHIRRAAIHSLSDRVIKSDNVILTRCMKLSFTQEHKSPFWHLRDFLLRPDFKCSCDSCIDN